MTEKKPVPKKKVGSRSASIELNNTATKSEIGKIVADNVKWFKNEIVQSDEECAERLDWFFKTVVENDELPTVEKMCLALGTTRTTVWQWEVQGNQGEVRSNMMKKAKEILAAIDAELVSKGKIPQVSYIFRSKNFFGMKDTQDVVIENKNPFGELTDGDSIRTRILSSTEGMGMLDDK